MNARRSAQDALLIAGFEVFRAIRSWQAVALLLLYMIAHGGGAYLFIEALSEFEDRIAAQMGVPTTRWPGALSEQLRQSEQLLDMLAALVGGESRVQQLIDRPLLAIFELWLGFLLAPFLAATAAAEPIAADLRTRALRFEALRTGRAELVIGRFLGQAVLALAATLVGLLTVWVLGMVLMVDTSPVALAVGLLDLGLRAAVLALPFAAVGILASTLTTSPAWARVMALAATAGSWVLYGILSWVSGSPWTLLADAVLPLLPQSWIGGLWSGGTELLVSLGACVGLGLAATGLAVLRFSRRDL